MNLGRYCIITNDKYDSNVDIEVFCIGNGKYFHIFLTISMDSTRTLSCIITLMYQGLAPKKYQAQYP